jgi:Tfp pilus assembly protein PilN
MRAVNLIPGDQRTGVELGAGRSQGGAYAVLALIGGLAVMAVLYGKADHAISTRQGQVTSLTAQAQRVEAQATQLAPYTSFLAMREQRTQAVETLLDSRFDWAHVFHEFGRVLPAGTSISSLTGTVGTVGATTPSSSSSKLSSSSAVASSTPPGSVPTFTLTGCAASQPVVAEMLERLRLIDGVSEVVLQSSTSSTSGSATATTSGSGNCPPHDPSYDVQVIFDALPSAAAVTAATKTVSDPTGTGATTPAGTGEGSASSGKGVAR